MIISPVKLPVLLQPYNGQNQFSQKSFVFLQYPKDSAVLSFNGIFESSDVPIRLEQAQQYSGIHCPVCGTQMLSKYDYDSIINKSLQVSNAQELIHLFKKNKKFVPQKFVHIFEDMDEIVNPEKMSLPEFRSTMSNYAYKRKQQVTHSVRDYLREYASKFPEIAQQKALNSVDEIRTKQTYQVQKDKIMHYAADLGLNETQKNEVMSKTLKNLFFANGYFMLFNSSKLSQISEDEYGKFIADRLFLPSVNNVVKISKFPVHENLENNKVIICNSCNQNQPKYVFWKSGNSRLLKDNMKSYLTDISYLMGDEKIDYSPDYIKAFVSATSKLSKQNIIYTPAELKAIHNVERSAKRHEHFTPIEQTQVDIPCAECGSIMLPHAKRKEIEKELKACNNPLEYAQVLEKNMKYVGKNYKVLAKIFLDIVHSNPQISNEKLVKEFIKKESHYSDKAIENAIHMFLENRLYVVQNYPLECVKIYDIFAKRLLRYIAGGKFDDYDVNKLFVTCVKDLDMKNYSVKPIYILIRNLRTISYKHLCATSDDELGFNDKDQVYTILFHLFKYNVATADHLLPENKGGLGDKYNLIGLCKSCNKTKSQKNILNWYIENKHLEKNLKEQLKVIDSMAKSGQIKDYDDWAKTIAQKVYEQTYGKLDLRKDFE